MSLRVAIPLFDDITPDGVVSLVRAAIAARASG